MDENDFFDLSKRGDVIPEPLTTHMAKYDSCITC